ncbi:MAG: hypothetical protein WCD79_17505 [Chthoniobacteraceae bacterium]
MTDLKNPTVIKIKGSLFLLIGITASALLLFNAPSLQNAFLLCMAVWGFARFYYFAFYVIEHYIDPTYRFAGLITFAQYLLQKQKK